MDKVLVIGAGLLGSCIIGKLAGGCEVHGADVDTSLGEPGCEFHTVDITSRRAVSDLVTSVRPAAVFHTAALTNVDRCERDKTMALRVNGTATGHIALACAKVDAYLCFISTDYIFDGKKGMYREDDPPRPLSAYGESKLLGETEVRCLGDRWKWVIARSSILYGAFRKRYNFASWIIDEVRNGRPIRVVADQRGSPTLAEDLSGAVAELWRRGATGIYNVAGREPASRYDFAVRLCEVFGLDRSLVTPVRTGELRQRAQRPEDSSLDVSKVERALGRRMLDVRGGLERMRELWERLPPQEAAPAPEEA
ncbi:MAG: dTDP-4-dehydrorhamnose reductase [Euryarchaeota archaeon]|nr:dTDP-4-dehydrorhamnose reductase [Euryarchaeota archaeon]